MKFDAGILFHIWLEEMGMSGQIKFKIPSKT